jgi:DNA-binding PadR family transcriptional regulator
MPLKYTILGFLNLEPMSGYELKHIFDHSVQHFWSAKQSQIYRELSKLLEKGYVEVKRIRQEKNPDKKVYSITESGQKELIQWIKNPLETEYPHRIPFLIQVFFSAVVSREDVLNILENQEKKQKRILNELKNETSEYLNNFSKDLSNLENEEFFRLTLELGIRHQETMIHWIEWAKQKINYLEKNNSEE